MDELIISCCPNCGYESRNRLAELAVRQMRVQCQRCFKSFNVKDNLIDAILSTPPRSAHESQNENERKLSAYSSQNAPLNTSSNTTNEAERADKSEDADLETVDLKDEVIVDKNPAPSQTMPTNNPPQRPPQLRPQLGKNFGRKDTPLSQRPFAEQSVKGRVSPQPPQRTSSNTGPLGTAQSTRSSKIVSPHQENETNETGAMDVTNASGVTNVTNAPDITNASDATNTSDATSATNTTNTTNVTEFREAKSPRLDAIQNPNFQAKNIEFGDTKRAALTIADEAGDDFRKRLPYDDSFDDVTLLDEYETETQTPFIARWLVIIGLALLAVFQIEYLWRDNLAQMAFLRPAIQQWCHFRECELPALASPSVIAIIESRIQQKEGNQVELQFTLRNTTQFEAELPVIEVHFSDVNDELVSNFHVFPKQYSQLITALTPNEQMNFKVQLAVTSPTPVSSFQIRTVHSPEGL